MSFTPAVDDLHLVSAVLRHGSIGAAARELRISQPSASARLATLERRLGAVLFERDTTGARATDAGRAFATEADHILGHLGQLADRVHAGAAAPLLRVATFPSLAALLFPAIDAALDAVAADTGVVTAVHQYVDHGDALINLVAEGSLDIAVVGLADQLPLPEALTTTVLGQDDLAMLTPPGYLPRSRRTPFDGVIPFHCLDLNTATIERRLSELGGRPRLCATGEVAVLTARATRQPALLAHSIASLYRRPEEDLVAPPFGMRFTLRMVTRTPPPPLLARMAPAVADAMGLAGL